MVEIRAIKTEKQQIAESVAHVAEEMAKLVASGEIAALCVIAIHHNSNDTLFISDTSSRSRMITALFDAMLAYRHPRPNRK